MAHSTMAASSSLLPGFLLPLLLLLQILLLLPPPSAPFSTPMPACFSTNHASRRISRASAAVAGVSSPGGRQLRRSLSASSSSSSSSSDGSDPAFANEGAAVVVPTLTTTPPTTGSSLSPSTPPVHPQIGDIVRYYDLDGGVETGQVLVGKLTYIFRRASGNGSNGSNGNSNSMYVAEVTELDDVGGGYYAEYSSSAGNRSGRRSKKKAERDLGQVSPILASFVQSEQAYRVPRTADGLLPLVRQETYDLDTYGGPSAYAIRTDVLETDLARYERLKVNLLTRTAAVGAFGALAVGWAKGTEDGAIYLAGVFASVLYLFLLSVKTDSMAPSSDNGNGGTTNRLGRPVANLRFLTPVLLIAGVALYNQSRGEMNPTAALGPDGGGGMFDTVTAEQFGMAVLGFLTYRVPLFAGQIRDALVGPDDDGQAGAMQLPGSAGIALKVMQQSDSDAAATAVAAKANNGVDLVTVLLVSGPQATGRSELVERLLAEEEAASRQGKGDIDDGNNRRGTLVAPRWVQRGDDGATFERLQRRQEFLQVDERATRGLTRRGILEAAGSRNGNAVVVVDADVGLARKLQALSGARLVGVWVGLETVGDFERRLQADIATGKIAVPPDETEESVVRARIKEIITEIEYGLSSGIFEFTILNSDPERSFKELKEAAAYAFK